MISDLIQTLPEVIVVGDIEMLFIGAAAALGFPKLATKIAEKKYGTDLDGDGEIGVPEDEDSDTDSTDE